MGTVEMYGERHGVTTVRARIIGEWQGGTRMWGVELYWVENGAEQYRRALTLTDNMETISRFCQTVDRGAVNPIHAADILRDLCDAL